MGQVNIGSPPIYDFSANPAQVPYGLETGGIEYLFSHMQIGTEHGFTGDGKVHAWKSTDSGATWAEQDLAHAPGGFATVPPSSDFVWGYTICQDGSNVYCVRVRKHFDNTDPNNSTIIDGISVNTYSLTTDTWGTATDLVVPAVGFMHLGVGGVQNNEVQVNLVRRGAGDLIFFYSGPTDTVGGNPVARGYYATFNGAAFGAATKLPGQTGRDALMIQGCTVDSHGNTHFFYGDRNQDGATQGHHFYHLAMDNTGAFGTEETVTTATFNPMPGWASNPITFTEASVEYLGFVAYINDNAMSTTQSLRLYRAATVAGNGPLTWQNSIISQGVDGDNTPRLPAVAFLSFIPSVVQLQERSGTLFVTWAWYNSITLFSFLYKSQSAFSPMSWSAPEVLINVSSDPDNYLIEQVTGWQMASRVAFATASVGTSFSDDLMQFNTVSVGGSMPQSLLIGPCTITIMVAGARTWLRGTRPAYDRGWMLDDYQVPPGGISRTSETTANANSPLQAVSDQLIGIGSALYTWGDDPVAGGDVGNPIPMVVETGLFDEGDPRALKLQGDLTLEIATNKATGAADLAITVLGDPVNVDNPTIIFPGQAIPNNSGIRNFQIISLNALAPGGITPPSQTAYLNRTVGIRISGSILPGGVVGRPELFGWQPSWVVKPETTTGRAEDWNDDGRPGWKWVRGFVIEGDTAQASGTDLAIDAANPSKVTSASFGAFTIADVGKHLAVLSAASGFMPDTYVILSTTAGAAILDHPVGTIGATGGIWALGIAKLVQVQSDGGAVQTTLTLSHPGQTTFPYALNPFNSHAMRLVPADLVGWREFRIWWVADSYPERALIQTKVLSLGGCRYVQGVRLVADTANVVTQFQILGDGKVTQVTTAPMPFNGKQTIAFPRANEWTPFFAHNLVIIPLGAASIWDDETEWISEPAPDLASDYITPPITAGFTSWWATRFVVLAYLSTAPVTLKIALDSGTVETYTFPSSAGVYTRSAPTPTQPSKSKWRVLTATSTAPFRLYLQDSYIWARPWGDQWQWIKLANLGDRSVDVGARI